MASDDVGDPGAGLETGTQSYPLAASKTGHRALRQARSSGTGA